MTSMPVIRAILLLDGLGYLATGAVLLFAPTWFYDNVGTFPPFNRHYAGDLGSFLLPLGLGLLLAARDPAGSRWLVFAVALGSLLHVLNHAYDAWLAGSWLSDGPTLLSLGVMAVLTVVAYAGLSRGGGGVASIASFDPSEL